MMLIQLLLPLYDNTGQRFGRDMYQEVSHMLTEQFGGLTSYSRVPAEGLWEDPSGNRVHDDVVVYEVMVEQLDHQWWQHYRETLEKRFEQHTLIIRALPTQVL